MMNKITTVICWEKESPTLIFLDIQERTSE